MFLARRRRESIAAIIFLWCGFVFLCGDFFQAEAASVSLAWKPSADPNVVGYSLFYGSASRQYTSCRDAGTNTELILDGLENGQTYYFATAAYTASGAVSPFSNEVSNTVPMLPVSATVPVSISTKIALMKKNRLTEKTSLRMPPSTAATFSADEMNHHPGIPPELDEPADVYNGLFYQIDSTGVPVISEATAGFLGNCVVKTNGHYSARFGCAGRFYSLSGTFSASGDSGAVVDRGDNGLPNLNIALHLELGLGNKGLTGIVSNMDTADPWMASLSAHLTTNAFAQEAKYFFISPPPAEQSAGPPPRYLCELTIATNGVVSLLGWLGDGAPVSQTVALAGDGSFPIYVHLYHQTGLLAGWVNLVEGIPNGSLTWIRPDSASQAEPEVKGFTHVLRFASTTGAASTILQLIR